MSLSADFPAEVGIEIPDNWEREHKSGIFWIANPTRAGEIKSHNKEHFRPRGIFIDANADGSSTTAQVRGILWGENENDWKTRTLACNVEHPRAYRAIDMSKTNARGIEINA